MHCYLQYLFVKINHQNQNDYQSYVRAEEEYQQKLNEKINSIKPKTEISTGFCYKCRRDLKLLPTAVGQINMRGEKCEHHD